MFSEVIKQMLSQDNESQIKLALEIIKKYYPDDDITLSNIKIILNEKYKITKIYDNQYELIKMQGIFSQINNTGYKHIYDIDKFSLENFQKVLKNYQQKSK